MNEQLDRMERKIDSLLNQNGLVDDSAFRAVKLYDEHGVSFETSKYGGVKLKAVEKLKAEWIAKGGKYKQAAETINEWFCFLRPGVQLPIYIFNQINTNQDNLFSYSILGGGLVIDEYWELRGTYQHKITKEYAFKLPDMFDDDAKNWMKTQATKIRSIPNHSVVKMGNTSNPRNPRFYQDFVSKIDLQVLAMMGRVVSLLNMPEGKPIKPNNM